MAITLAEAQRIIQGTVAKADELKIKINVAVCDAGGRLIAFSRMDDAPVAGIYGSQGKAAASAVFGRASGEMQERADSPIVRGIVARMGAGDVIPSQGAVAIFRGTALEGACGVGGGTSQQDEDCARAGVTAAKFATTR